MAAWLAEWLEPATHAAGLSALEFGAGDGLFTKFLANRFSHLTATDVAPRMVEQGKRRLPQVDWRVADAWRFHGQCVDRLYSASLLHWCNDPVSVLRQWRRHVRRGGRMLHGFYVAPTLPELQYVAGGYSPVAWRSPAQWETIVRDAGWVVLQSEAQSHVQHFASAMELFRFFHQTGAMTPHRMPVANLRRMIGDYQRTFAASVATPTVTSTWTLFRIEAAN